MQEKKKAGQQNAPAAAVAAILVARYECGKGLQGFC